jgi:hypothetical protein
LGRGKTNKTNNNKATNLLKLKKMASKFVTLLLLVCLVTLQDKAIAQAPQDPQVCYNHCYEKNVKNMPSLVAQTLCIIKCQFGDNPIHPLEGNLARKNGPSSASSPIPTPKNH